MRLIHGECLEEMDKLINEGIKVDAVICDPPYGTTPLKWDSVIEFTEVWNKIRLLIEPKSPTLLFGQEPYSSQVRLSNLSNYKYDWYFK